MWVRLYSPPQGLERDLDPAADADVVSALAREGGGRRQGGAGIAGNDRRDAGGDRAVGATAVRHRGEHRKQRCRDQRGRHDPTRADEFMRGRDIDERSIQSVADHERISHLDAGIAGQVVDNLAVDHHGEQDVAGLGVALDDRMCIGEAGDRAGAQHADVE